jgi:hypothetical protein
MMNPDNELKRLVLDQEMTCCFDPRLDHCPGNLLLFAGPAG